MPAAGFEHPVVGAVAFSAIKLFGYTFAAHRISLHYGRLDLNHWKVGSIRTLIGMGFGMLYFALASVGFPSLIILLGLIPIRVVEWTILLRIFYDERLGDRSKLRDVTILGTIWSFLLDVPALMGAFTVAGFWVC